MLDGVELIGTGRIVERIWTKPAHRDPRHRRAADRRGAQRAGPGRQGQVSACGSRPATTRSGVSGAMPAHLEQHAPWGAKVTVTLEHDGEPCVIDATGPAYDAARAAFADGLGRRRAGRHRASAARSRSSPRSRSCSRRRRSW